MTDAEWQAMTPREQDAMVAEKVLGLVIWQGKFLEPMVRENKDSPWRRVPKLTSSWPGFGLVVEAMRKMGWYLVLNTRERPSAMFRFVQPKQDIIEGPPAICDCPKAATALAAVRAMEAAK